MNRPMLAVLLFSTALAVHAQKPEPPKELIASNTQWVGSIRQGDAEFPANIYIEERKGDRISGRVRFHVDGKLCQLYLWGEVMGDRVAWITAKKEGNVTAPGLYVGKLTGKTISGTWEVPTAGQYDVFSATLTP